MALPIEGQQGTSLSHLSARALFAFQWFARIPPLAPVVPLVKGNKGANEVHVFMSQAANNVNNKVASANAIRGVFHDRQDELQWLAYFITADRNLAEKCVVDACTLSQKQNPVFEQWLATWARYATVRAAINTQHGEIRQLAATYEQVRCTHHRHPRLPAASIERLTRRTDSMFELVDALARAALIICGVEGHSFTEAALLLGVRNSIVLAAYCQGLQCLDTAEDKARSRTFVAPAHLFVA